MKSIHLLISTALAFRYKIQYLAAAPVVMNTLLTYPERRHINHPIKMWTAGSPPAPTVIRQFMKELGIQVQTAYGLTESYGPISTYTTDPEWLVDSDDVSAAGKQEKKGKKLTDDELCGRLITQCRDIMVEDVQVMDPETMKAVPYDGQTLGKSLCEWVFFVTDSAASASAV